VRLVEREVAIAAAPPVVYAWLTEAERLVQWIGADESAVLEAEPGGRLWWRHRNGDACSGYFVTLQPYSRVTFTYGWERADVGIPPGSSLVDITLEDRGGRTLLRLVQTGLSDEAAEAHQDGWTHYLGRLAVGAAGLGLGPDEMAAQRVPSALDAWPSEPGGWFARLAELFLTDETVTRSTMMGFPCLRKLGQFFVSYDQRDGSLVVKLSQERVAGLVASGAGFPFAPAGKVFRQWVAVPAAETDRWLGLMAEAQSFSDSSRKD
jgi:uncharacterized protein YndB with AHSA1/START domain